MKKDPTKDPEKSYTEDPENVLPRSHKLRLLPRTQDRLILPRTQQKMVDPDKILPRTPKQLYWEPKNPTKDLKGPIKDPESLAKDPGKILGMGL